MDMPFETYVERINHTLEHVVAPEIESDFVRGQVFAVIELLSQLQGRIEHRHDFLLQDVQRGRETLDTLCEALLKAGVTLPDDVAAVRQPVDLMDVSGLQLREERERIEFALTSVLDLLHVNRAKISDTEAIERAALEQVQQGIFRDLMLFRPQRFDRISRSKRKGES